jgi:predicted Zn finger-like uncharacterized protein
MSISFACPECKVQIEVDDEFAGLAGQCPRCQQVITIPSPNMPKPKPTVVATPVPTTKDKWEDSRDDRPRPPRTRTRRPPPPRQPAGPTWPWVVGIIGAIVVVLLLFISFIVLVSYRRPEPTRPVIIDMQQGVNHPGVNPQGNGVIVGRLEGNRAILQDGVFQIRSQLNHTDPFDLQQQGSRAKLYQVELIGNVNYIIELESHQFDSVLRLEENNFVWRRQVGGRGVLAATIPFQQRNTQIMTICVTNIQQAVGNFTLTIREANRPRPNVP